MRKMKLKALKIKRQRGVAIVLALFIVALVAAMAYEMMYRLTRDNYREQLIMRDAQAEAYAQGSVYWGMDVLMRNWEQQKNDRPIDKLPIKLPIHKVNNYTIATTIQDMQGYFNINNLTKPEAQYDFKHLLQIIDPKMSDNKARTIVTNIFNWLNEKGIDSDLERYYAHLNPPYGPAKKPLIDLSEIKSVKEVTPALYEQLKDYVVALPAETKLNVQTASLPLLLLLSPIIDQNGAEEIIHLREKKPFVKLADFSESDIAQKYQIQKDKIDVMSQYFLIETKVTIEQQKVILLTLAQRIIQDTTVRMHIIWQKKGISV